MGFGAVGFTYLFPSVGPGVVGGSGIVANLIAKPVNTQTSAAGSQPFTWQMADSATYFPGFYLEIQRSTGSSISNALANLSSGVLNADQIYQLTPQDLAGGNISTGTSSTPVGPLALKTRVGHEDGMGGYVWGPFSDPITDTIVASFGNVAFDPSKKSTTTILSNGNLTMTGQMVGGFQQALVNTQQSAPTLYCEWNILALNKLDTGFGIVGASFNFNDFHQVGTRVNELGITAFGKLRSGGTSILVDGSGIDGASGPNQYIMGMCVHLATGKVWYRNATAWQNGTPAFNADGTIAGSSTGGTIASGLAGQAIIPVADVYDADSWKLNAGASPFAFSVPTNCTPGIA